MSNSQTWKDSYLKTHAADRAASEQFNHFKATQPKHILRGKASEELSAGGNFIGVGSIPAPAVETPPRSALPGAADSPATPPTKASLGEKKAAAPKTPPGRKIKTTKPDTTTRVIEDLTKVSCERPALPSPKSPPTGRLEPIQRISSLSQGQPAQKVRLNFDISPLVPLKPTFSDSLSSAVSTEEEKSETVCSPVSPFHHSDKTEEEISSTPSSLQEKPKELKIDVTDIHPTSVKAEDKTTQTPTSSHIQKVQEDDKPVEPIFPHDSAALPTHTGTKESETSVHKKQPKRNQKRRIITGGILVFFCIAIPLAVLLPIFLSNSTHSRNDVGGEISDREDEDGFAPNITETIVPSSSSFPILSSPMPSALASISESGSITVSTSNSLSNTQSQSGSGSTSNTHSSTASISESSSGSISNSASGSISQSGTHSISISGSSTISGSNSASGSTSRSGTHSISTSGSSTISDSISHSASGTRSNSQSQSESASHSAPPSTSPSVTKTSSVSSSAPPSASPTPEPLARFADIPADITLLELADDDDEATPFDGLSVIARSGQELTQLTVIRNICPALNTGGTFDKTPPQFAVIGSTASVTDTPPNIQALARELGFVSETPGTYPSCIIFQLQTTEGTVIDSHTVDVTVE